MQSSPPPTALYLAAIPSPQQCWHSQGIDNPQCTPCTALAPAPSHSLSLLHVQDLDCTPVEEPARLTGSSGWLKLGHSALQCIHTAAGANSSAAPATVACRTHPLRGLWLCKSALLFLFLLLLVFAGSG